MKTYLTFLLAFFTLSGYSQTSLNGYKYVFVPERFSFSKVDNQYGLSTTAQQLLEQKGFVAYIGSGEMPAAVAANRCSALTLDVVEKSGLFTTNLTFMLKDCQGNIIYKSKEGKSREKEWSLAYSGALRDAFTSLDKVPYKYDSSSSAQATTAAPASAQPVAQPATQTVTQTTAQTITQTEAVGKIADTLYAQAIPNGYQLIDLTPKKVLILLKTSVQDFFIAQAGAFNGVVFKKDAGWVFEYYRDGKLVSQKLTINNL